MFEEIFEKYHLPVFYYFANRGLSREESSDLTQETFVRVYKGMDGFRGEASARTWILKIASNVFKNEIRSRRTIKRDHHAVSLDQPISGNSFVIADVLEEEPTSANHPVERVLADERHELLHRAMQELPRQQRRCILLYVVQNLSYQEIADVLGISIGTVKSHLHSAKRRLRELLRGHYSGLDFE